MSNSKTMIDRAGQTVTISDDGLVRIDGIISFRKVTAKNGVVLLQFCDTDRLRAACRGTRYVEVPLKVLADILTDGGT